MNIAQVKLSDGRIRKVKNLGWVLRHWQSIVLLEWSNARDEKGSPIVLDGVFRAYLHNGSIYEIPYASFEVWQKFIDRPVFRSLPVTVNGIEGIV